MYLIVTASLVLVPFLLGGTGRAAPVGEVATATATETIQDESLTGNDVADITKRRIHDRPYPPELPTERLPDLHVPPPHFVDPLRFAPHGNHEKRTAETESNVKLQPRKRWGGWGGNGNNGCCGPHWNNGWGRKGCCGP
jgi:hypothetical protein